MVLFFEKVFLMYLNTLLKYLYFVFTSIARKYFVSPQAPRATHSFVVRSKADETFVIVKTLSCT